jgi:CRP-like cAMP-binding protein
LFSTKSTQPAAVAMNVHLDQDPFSLPGQVTLKKSPGASAANAREWTVRRPIQTEAFLANLSLFRALSADALHRLADGSERRKLVRGEALFREGERPSSLYAVVYGRLKLSTQAAQGHESIVALVGAAQSFGEASLFLDRPQTVSAIAVDDSLVLGMARQVVLAELACNPVFAQRMMAALAERVESLVRERQDYTLGSATHRFVAWLLRNAGAEDTPAASTLRLPIAKRLLAAQLNLSAEHLSRILHELSAADLISVHVGGR